MNISDQKSLQNLITRIENMNGKMCGDGTKITFLGDGQNPGTTSVELLYFLKILQQKISQ